MEQNWAQDAKKEISKDNELKNLKERCKILEEKLARYMHNPAVTASLGASVVNSPVGLSSPVDAPIKLTNSPMVKLEDDTNMVDDMARPVKEHDYDELDLTRQFDLLHIKSNGTIHLGATHWLAIMKGDPYLKLLWTHIFTMREKLLEYYTNGSGHKRRKDKRTEENVLLITANSKLQNPNRKIILSRQHLWLMIHQRAQLASAQSIIER